MEKQKSRRKWAIVAAAITLIALVLLTTLVIIPWVRGNNKFKLVLSPSSVTLPRGQEYNLNLNVISTGYEGNVTFSLSPSWTTYGFIVNHKRGLEDIFLKAYENKTIAIPVSARSDAKLNTYNVFVIGRALNDGNWIFRVDSNLTPVKVTEGSTG